MYGPSSSSHQRYPAAGVALGGGGSGRNDPYARLTAFIGARDASFPTDMRRYA